MAPKAAPKSLNGWPVLKPGSPLLKTGTVPGTTCRITAHKDVLPLFLALGYDYDDSLRRIDAGRVDDGCYAYRMARAADDWSNHSSATAVDWNWSKEGAQGSKMGRAFFAVPENKADIKWLKQLYPILNWGGDWKAKDYMHWELAPGTTLAEVKALIKHLGIDAKGVRHNDIHGRPLKVPRG